ncbi:MAG: ATP-binding protein [Patescibacteria group bacterium]
MLLITTIISCVFSLIISIIVIRHKRNNYSSIIFFIFCLALFFWSISNYASIIVISKFYILLWMRIVMIFAVIQSMSFLLFINNFPHKHLVIRKKYVYLASIIAILNFLLCCSPYLFRDVLIEDGFRSPVIAPGILLFILTTVGSIISGFIILLKRLKKSRGLVKHQLYYIFLGSLIMFFLIILFNLIFVIIFHISFFVDWGPVFVLPFIFSTTYAIIRYRLMDIKLIITRSLIFFFLTLTVASTFVLVSSLAGIFFANSFGANQYVIWFVAAIIIVLGLDPIKDALAKETDKVFFKGKVNYDAVLKNITEILSEEVHVKEIIIKTQNRLKQDLKIKDATLLIYFGDDFFLQPEEVPTKAEILSRETPHYNEEAQTQEAVQASDDSSVNNAIVAHNKKATQCMPALAKHFTKDAFIIVADELERKISDCDDPEKAAEMQAIYNEIQQMNASMVVPIYRNKELSSILFLGQKTSGDVFNNEDIQMLEVLAPQLSAALFKATLFQEAKLFNIKLKQEVEHATHELKHANEHLQELDDAKSEFMSIASHQLRTPLSGIMGYLSMILDGDYGNLSEEQTPIMKEVFSASQRLIRLVNLFLNVTRIEAGRLKFNFTEIDMPKILGELVHELKPAADKKGLKLIMAKTKDKIPPITVDADKIQDIVLNLIDNATKYTQKGKITVDVKLQNKKHILITVTDTGMGIDPEEVPKLFNKFVRGDGMVQVNPNGAGLGLFIAKKITEGHHGDIWAESPGVGKGTTFNVLLPIKQPKVVEEAEKK